MKQQPQVEEKPPASNVLTIREAAIALKLSPQTIRRLIREDALSAHRLGRQWRVPTEAVEKFFAA